MKNLKRTLLVALAAIVSTGCQTISQVSTLTTNVYQWQLQGKSFELVSINDLDIIIPAGYERLYMDIGKNMKATGYTGCNNYFGYAQVEKDKFKVNQMAVTQKGCRSTDASVERTFLEVMADWSDVTLEGGTLTIQDHSGKLVFQERHYR